MFDQDQIGEVTLALCSGVTELVYKGGVDTEQAEEGVMIGKNLDLIMMNIQFSPYDCCQAQAPAELSCISTSAPPTPSPGKVFEAQVNRKLQP